MTPTPLLPIRMKLAGAPRTKKNHGKVVARTRNGRRQRFHVPSDAYIAWVNAVSHAVGPDLMQLTARKRLPIPKTVQVNCAARFFRDANAGDAVGYYQGLADLLQHLGVLADDVSIVSWDGSRLDKDAANPRVELELTAVA